MVQRLLRAVNMSHRGRRDVSLSIPAKSRCTTAAAAAAGNDSAALPDGEEHFSCSLPRPRRLTPPLDMRPGSPPQRQPCRRPPALRPPTHPHCVKPDEARPAAASCFFFPPFSPQLQRRRRPGSVARVLSNRVPAFPRTLARDTARRLAC